MVRRSGGATAVVTKKDISTLRGTLAYLQERADLLTTTVEVDPDLEIAGIAKALDGGPALLFNQVRGYPHARFAANIFSSGARLARLFDVEDPRKLKFKIVEALRHPLPPRVVEDAPCQEVVITQDIDPKAIIPAISHTEQDPGRTIGGGNTLVTGDYFWGGTHIAFNRLNFRGKDYASFQISPGSHGDMIATAFYRKGPIPMTINMGVPPACTLMAGGGFLYVILPKGCDELGVAGAIQGFPVDIVKAKTVDAYAIANAEYIIEGYLDTTEHVWESEQAEREGRQGVFPFHPEWSGYMGKAYRTYKFQATAITHRKDRPIYYNPIVHSYEDHYIDVTVREASFLELADRICPGLVIDTHVPLGMTDWGGVIFQFKKRRKRDDGFQKNILTTAIAASQGMRLAMAVDEDINIYSADDILWALTTRVDGDKDIELVCPGGMGQTFQPAERAAAAPGAQWVRAEAKYAGGMAIDATVPFEFKWAFERPAYPVNRVNLTKWFAEREVAKALASLPEYAKWLNERGI